MKRCKLKVIFIIIDIIITDEDPVPCITRRYFDEALKVCRRSVSDADIARYQVFARTLSQARGFGGPSGGEAGNDLYA